MKLIELIPVIFQEVRSDLKVGLALFGVWLSIRGFYVRGSR